MDNSSPKLNIKSSLSLKILPLLFLPNLSLLLGVFLKLDLLVLIIIGLTLSAASTLISLFFLKELKDIAQKIYFSVFRNPTSASFSDLEILKKSVNQISGSLNQTYAKIAYDRDIAISEKSRLATIIDSFPYGVIVTDLHRKIILMNSAAEKLLNKKEEQFLGLDISRAFSVSDKQRLLNVEEFCPVDLSSGRGPQQFNPQTPLTINLADNSKVEVRFKSQTITGSLQANLGCVLLLRDSSSSDGHLESMQLDFVSMASHELRTPLTSIIGYLNVLMDEGKEKLDPHQKDFLGKIYAAAQQLSGLVSNLLNVSKVERGAISVNTKAIDWVETLTQAVEENKVQAVQKNISLELDPNTKSLPMVSADSIRIMEVLNNLISNAVNYTQEGGEILVSAKLEGSEVITSVKDNGRGIPADAMPNLFTKFFRVTTAQDISSNSKGTGLGLYLSKSIIELHRGRIWADSQLSKGSTFYFTLPVALNQTPTAGVIHAPSGITPNQAGLTSFTKPNIV